MTKHIQRLTAGAFGFLILVFFLSVVHTMITYFSSDLITLAAFGGLILVILIIIYSLGAILLEGYEDHKQGRCADER